MDKWLVKTRITIGEDKMYDDRGNRWIVDYKERDRMVAEIDALVGVTDVIGTSEELFDKLTNRVVGTSRHEYWPESADSFEHRLREVEGTLSSVGIRVLWMDYYTLVSILDGEEIKLCCPGFKAYRLETAITVLTRHPRRYLSGN